MGNKRTRGSKLSKVAFLAAGVLLAGCNGGAGSKVMPAPSVANSVVKTATLTTPQSKSPALIPAPPMMIPKSPAPPMVTAQYRARPMDSSRIRPQEEIRQLAFIQIPGAAVFVAASPDGSLWALGTGGVGSDKYIYHYSNGTWTNLPGLASRLAVAPDNTLYALNSAGGIYHYANGAWNALAGGASEISIAADGSAYVISNVYGGPFGNGIYHYVNGAFVQVPGAGSHIATSWDTGTYLGGAIVPGGFWVTNATGSMYYYNPQRGFLQIPGGALLLASTLSGGLFALGNIRSSIGSSIYYNDLSTDTWVQEPGAGVGLSTDGRTLYIVGAGGGIYEAPTGPPATQPLSGPGLGPDGGWGPSSVANAFKFPSQTGYGGTGVTVAIIGATPHAAFINDVSAFLQYFGIAHTGALNYRLVNGGSDGSVSALGEAALDVETVAGLAPGANLIYYEVPDLTYGSFLAGYNQILADGLAQIVSVSYGSCENSQNLLDIPTFQQAASNGVAFIASSGDQGEACSLGSSYYVGVNYPASDANVIGVGGIESYPSLSSSLVWNDFLNGSSGEASGGGVSRNIPLPSYQSGLQGTVSKQFRNVPDISLPSANDTLYFNGQHSRVGGTSWAAPQFAAMLAGIYEYCQASFQYPVILPYVVFVDAGYGDFIDVTSGNNQWGGSSTYYAANVGYDNASGIGVPLGTNIANTICPNRSSSAVRRRLSAAASIMAPSETAVPRSPRVARPTTATLIDMGERDATSETKFLVALTARAAGQGRDSYVSQFLAESGVKILKTYKTHLIIEAEAPTSTISSLFRTPLHKFRDERYGERYANTADAVLPAQIAPDVQGVLLDNLVGLRPL